MTHSDELKVSRCRFELSNCKEACAKKVRRKAEEVTEQKL